MQYDKVIAIDGPSGTGKSAIAKRVSLKLGHLYVDTGAMYRAIGLLVDRAELPFEESGELEKFLQTLKIEVASGDLYNSEIKVNGEDLSQEIREHRVSDLASRISRLPMVRQFLLEFQRSLARTQVCVMEGRDIGTVISLRPFVKSL